MSEITLSISEESLLALHVPAEQAAGELRMLAAVKLFEMKRLSSAPRRGWPGFLASFSCNGSATTALRFST